MRCVEGLDELRAARAQLKEPVGLVPTMGFLHDGHLSLVRRSREECASTVVSIFVNPTQFGPGEDLERYPRDEARDRALLEEAGVDLVWLPTPAVLYPPGFGTWVEVESLSTVLEGAARPGHFRGVATVVAKLFNAVGPQRAYFGQKDAQQVAVIRRMVEDLNFALDVVVGETVREPDGLAMSSRNVYLSDAQRRAAVVLSRALRRAQELFAEGSVDAGRLRSAVREVMAVEPLVELEYVSCAHPETLAELEGPVDRALLSLAARVGSTRLIDNTTLCS